MPTDDQVPQDTQAIVAEIKDVAPGESVADVAAKLVEGAHETSGVLDGTQGQVLGHDVHGDVIESDGRGGADINAAALDQVKAPAPEIPEKPLIDPVAPPDGPVVTIDLHHDGSATATVRNWTDVAPADQAAGFQVELPNVEQLVETWFAKYFHNMGARLSDDLHAVLHGAKEDLKALLRAL